MLQSCLQVYQNHHDLSVAERNDIVIVNGCQFAHEQLNAAINTGSFSRKLLKSCMYLEHPTTMQTVPLPALHQQPHPAAAVQPQNQDLDGEQQQPMSEQQQQLLELGAPTHAFTAIVWSEVYVCSYEALHAFTVVKADKAEAQQRVVTTAAAFTTTPATSCCADPPSTAAPAAVEPPQPARQRESFVDLLLRDDDAGDHCDERQQVREQQQQQHQQQMSMQQMGC